MSAFGGGYMGNPPLKGMSPPMQQPSPFTGNAQYAFPMPGGSREASAIAGSGSRQGFAGFQQPALVPSVSASKSKTPQGKPIPNESKDTRNERLQKGELSVVTTYEYTATSCLDEKENFYLVHTNAKRENEPADPGAFQRAKDFVKQKLENRNGRQVLWMNVDGRNLSLLRYILDLAIEAPYSVLAYQTITMPKQRVSCIVLKDTIFLLAKIPELETDFNINAGKRDDEEKNQGENLAEMAMSNLRARLEKKDDPDCWPCVSKGMNAEANKIINYERIGFLVNWKTGTLITIQGGDEGDVWEGVRAELKDLSKGHALRSRKDPVLHLFCRLMRVALESCEDIDVTFELILKEVFASTEAAEDGQRPADEEDRKAANEIKVLMEAFQRRVVPLRDAFEHLVKPESPTFALPSEIRPYFEDLHHYALRIMDNMESHYQGSTELEQKHTDLDAQRDAKVQFIISMALAFFSPLSFIVGLYGENFTGDPETGTGGIPELTWKDGYTYVWYLMMAVILAIIVGFAYLGIIPVRSWIRKAMKKMKCA